MKCGFQSERSRDLCLPGFRAVGRTAVHALGHLAVFLRPQDHVPVLCEAVRYVKFVSPSSEFAFIFVCFPRLLAISTAHNSG